METPRYEYYNPRNPKVSNNVNPAMRIRLPDMQIDAVFIPGAPPQYNNPANYTIGQVRRYFCPKSSMVL